MKLRPHHLMCTQGYSGKGYNEEFIQNMDKVTYELRTNKDCVIELVFSTDDICKACPSMIGVNLCETNEKVKNIDEKVIKYFNLEEKEYNYNDIVNYIKSNITPNMMDDICGKCNWYKMSKCKKVICG
ncbi:DUF1284 domain-containing protein [Paraclostridium bifermentans]|uniref:DUF1284 domain-containing protein n=1 Tax=Paraclostridium bifermentans TaxID=1490 RepID=UPI00359C7992